MKRLDKLHQENKKLKEELACLEQQRDNLEQILNRITFAKAFRLWQGFNRIKKLIKETIKNPGKVLKAFKILLSKGPKGVINKLKSQEQQFQQTLTINQQYQLWLKKHYPTAKELKKQKKESKKFKCRPKISIITPTYNTPSKFLKECIESVLNQTYDNWELCIADDASTNQKVRKIIKEYAKHDKRIKYTFRQKHGHICQASNDALKLATGEFVALLDHDDILWPNALYEVVKLLSKKPQTQFLYSDEDRISEDGSYHYQPFFKPDWSPDLLFSFMYTGHFTIYRKNLVIRTGGFREGYEYSQDYDLALRMSEVTNQICHLRKILYSWRAAYGSAARGDKEFARRTNIAALESAVERRKLNAEVIAYPYANRVRFLLDKYPKISIIIPTDNYTNLKKSLSGIRNNTSYKNIEIVVVTNSLLIQKFKKNIPDDLPTKFVPYDKQFNFSEKCNQGAKYSSGEYLLFLNDDIIPLRKGWLYNMVEVLQRTEVGGVGAKLLYETGQIQHAGMVSGVRELIGTAFHQHEADSNFYFNFIQSTRNVSMISGACFLVPKRIFKKVNGFDEKYLPIYHSDVDLSFKIRNHGYLLVYTPFATLKHVGHASLFKHDKKTEKNTSDLIIINRWPNYISYDPYYTDEMVYFLHTNGNYNFKLFTPNSKIEEKSILKSKKILMVSHELEFNGAPILLFNLAKYLKEKGATVYFASPKKGPLVKLLQQDGIPVYTDVLLLESIQTEHLNFYNNFDLIIPNTIHSFRIIEAAKTIKKPIIWLIHESGFGEKMIRQNEAIVKSLRLADKVVFSTKLNKCLYSQYLNNNGVVVNYGINIYNSNRYNLKKQPNKFYFLHLASIEPRKGQDIFLKAIKLLPQKYKTKFEFFLIGKILDYLLFNKIKPLMDNETNIHLLGTINYKNVNEFFKLADVFICSSRDESFPLTILEAMYHKKIIISTNVGGIPEILKNKVNGILIEPNNSKLLAEKIIEVYNNKKQYHQLALNAHQQFMQKYSLQKYGANINKLIKQFAD